MVSETHIAETKPRSCCSGKKIKPEKSEDSIIPNREITPTIKIEKATEEKGCQCCSNNAEPESDGTLPHKAMFF